MLSLASLVIAFATFHPTSKPGRTLLWVFAIHNLLSCVMIIKIGVGDTPMALWTTSNYISGSLHIFWLLIAVITAFDSGLGTAFDSILIVDTKNDKTECN
jgi:hypothetical protein